jgi:hypothetical protein
MYRYVVGRASSSEGASDKCPVASRSHEEWDDVDEVDLEDGAR